MKNLRIRAYPQTGIISDQFLPLDGILFYHACREKFGEEDYTTPGKSSENDINSVKLPFKVINEGKKDWFYACSFAQWPEHTVIDKETYSKRFDVKYADLIDFQGRRGKVRGSSGRYKSYHIEVYYRHCMYVDWFAVGEKEELERLLKFCTHLGKKHSQGWGAIKRWEVDIIDTDKSVYDGEKKMRAIPDQESLFLYGIRPSYWNRQNQVNCVMP